MMIIQEPEIYRRIQYTWVQSLPPNLQLMVTDFNYAQQFRIWLADLGARVVLSEKKDLVRNFLDFAPGYDQIVFDNDQEATWFLLKLS